MSMDAKFWQLPKVIDLQAKFQKIIKNTLILSGG
jgi:hypothetical protein